MLCPTPPVHGGFDLKLGLCCVLAGDFWNVCNAVLTCFYVMKALFIFLNHLYWENEFQGKNLLKRKLSIVELESTIRNSYKQLTALSRLHYQNNIMTN